MPSRPPLDPTRAARPPYRCLWFTKGLGRGGVERLLVDMAPLVDSTRFAVDVAYVLPWKNSYVAMFEDAGVAVTCLGSSLRGDPRWVARLAHLVSSRSYDLIHTHAPLPAVAARAVASVRRRPAVIHTEHNMWPRYRAPTRWLNSLTYRRNDGVIAVSDTVAGSIHPWPGRRPVVQTIRHGTVLGSVRSWDEEERRQRRLDLGLPADGYVIGKVGNFTAKKNHLNLLRAVAEPGSLERAHLALVGLGPLENELRRTAAELGLADRVVFLGSRDDVFDILPLFDLFCLSSDFEGLPIALVEAMATGLPCVATSVGGIPEIVRDGETGLLVPPGDHTALARALGRLMDDPALGRRYGQGARKAAQELDLQRAVDQMQAIYLQALEARRAQG